MNKEQIDEVKRKAESNNIETRVIPTTVEIREEDDSNKVYVEGYALKFNQRSNNMGGWFEVIKPESLNEDVLANSDVRALINHNENQILGRSSKGTLELSIDETGLKYRFELNTNLSYAKDLLINLREGNIDQSSFAFTISPEGEQWVIDTDDSIVRNITSISRLYDVSPVTYPAYENSNVGVAERSFLKFKKELEDEKTKDEEEDLKQRSLLDIKMKLVEYKGL